MGRGWPSTLETEQHVCNGPLSHMLANLAHTPERGHLALLEAVAQRGDALGGESATAIFVDTAELVAIQAARGKQ